MRLLLDTHALIWFCEGSSSLSPTARAAMEDRGNECHVSHADLGCPHRHEKALAALH